jgi:hypothetical protein
MLSLRARRDASQGSRIVAATAAAATKLREVIPARLRRVSRWVIVVEVVIIVDAANVFPSPSPRSSPSSTAVMIIISVSWEKRMEKQIWPA